MSKRVVIASGGTGGHIFPAQNLCSQLQQKCPGIELLFIAKGLSTNQRFNSSAFSFVDVESGPINPKALPFSSLKILKGIFTSLRALKKFRPDVVIGFGSYHSFPVLCAAFILRIPIILHEANSIPGKVNRLFSRFAAWTGVFFPGSKEHLKGNVLLTDIPLRKEFMEGFCPTKEEALAYYGLEKDLATVLVFGGSLGAKKLNEIAADGLVDLACKLPFQLLHFTGNQETTELLQKQYSRHNIKAVVQNFEHNMQYAWRLADVALCRSGASTIAEAVACKVPAVYVPYPHASDGHQDKNAQYVTSLGGGIWFKEKGLEPKRVAEALEKLLAAADCKSALAKAEKSMQNSRFPDLVLKFLEENG